MTIFISDLADMMSSCAVVISPLSMMMETPGRGPRNEMRLLLCRQETLAKFIGCGCKLGDVIVHNSCIFIRRRLHVRHALLEGAEAACIVVRGVVCAMIPHLSCRLGRLLQYFVCFREMELELLPCFVGGVEAFPF